MCISCLLSFHDSVESKKVMDESRNQMYEKCPSRSCDGEIIRVSEEIEFVIKVLNVKGYATTKSSSGRVDTAMSTTYIEFDPSVKELPNMPKGFDLILKQGKGKPYLRIEKVIFDRIDSLEDAEFFDIQEIDSEDGSFTIEEFDMKELSSIMLEGMIGGVSAKNSIKYKNMIRETADDLLLWASDLPLYSEYFFGSFIGAEPEEKPVKKNKEIDVEAAKKHAPSGVIKINNEEDPNETK